MPHCEVACTHAWPAAPSLPGPLALAPVTAGPRPAAPTLPLSPAGSPSAAAPGPAAPAGSPTTTGPTTHTLAEAPAPTHGQNRGK